METENYISSAPASGTSATDANAIDELRQLQRSSSQQQPAPAKKIDFMAHYASKLRPESGSEREARERREGRAALARERSARDGMLTSLIAGAGSRYAECTLENFRVQNDRQRAAVEAIHEFIGGLEEHVSTGTGLVFFGPVGCGKDHLAFAVCRHVITILGRPVRWINGQDWFGSVRDAMGDDGQREAHLIQSLVPPAVLMISDPLPPTGALTQHQSTMLYRLIDARYSRGLPTYCSINVADDGEADARMGAATWDRLCHGAWKIGCNWASHRRPARSINSSNS